VHVSLEASPKKSGTKHSVDNAWVVEYLLDRFATQACRDLCDKVCTTLPQDLLVPRRYIPTFMPYLIPSLLYTRHPSQSADVASLSASLHHEETTERLQTDITSRHVQKVFAFDNATRD
jgi:hypothetical protein